mmetsp:Transcript_1249/g.1452  ORF Transcript_1249/g.1452 Transcript_1249/m.1452 type:complete len:240 (+) Transcript_1249:1-720(+)
MIFYLTKAEKGPFAIIHLDGSIKCRARLHWHIAVTEKDEVAHESSSTKLRSSGFLGDQLGVIGLAIVLHVMWVKVMEGLARPGGLMGLTLPSLQHIVDLEANVIDLRVPFGWHSLWEGPGISSSLGEVEDHVLNQRTSEDIVELKGWALVQQLVVLPGGSTTIKGFPIPLQCCLVLGIIVLALRVLNSTRQMTVVEVMLLHKGLPILICIQPFRLGQQRDGRILERDPQSTRAVLQNLL